MGVIFDLTACNRKTLQPSLRHVTKFDVEGLLMRAILLTVLGTMTVANLASAQTPASELATFHFDHMASDSQFNELVIVLKQVSSVSAELPLDPASRAVTVRGSQNQLAMATRLVKQLDRPDAQTPSEEPHRFEGPDGVAELIYIAESPRHVIVQEILTTLRQVPDITTYSVLEA